MNERSHKKYQHEKCVVLLDDCFCNDDVAAALTAAGFNVECFTTHFPRSENEKSKRQQGVKDPHVIALSHRQGWLILTADRSMRVAHIEDFRRFPNATVLAITHHEGGDELWVKALVKAKAEIERKFKKQQRPWYAQINQRGEITVCQTISIEPPQRTPKEKL